MAFMERLMRLCLALHWKRFPKPEAVQNLAFQEASAQVAKLWRLPLNYAALILVIWYLQPRSSFSTRVLGWVCTPWPVHTTFLCSAVPYLLCSLAASYGRWLSEEARLSRTLPRQALLPLLSGLQLAGRFLSVLAWGQMTRCFGSWCHWQTHSW